MKGAQLSAELLAATDEMMERLARFTPESADQKPGDGEWSAAEVGEHLLILETVANKVVRGETIDSTRVPDAKMAIIKMAMTDLQTKRTAPDAVRPSGKAGNLTSIKAGLQKQRELLLEAIETTDLSRACVAFKHPALGTLTVMEWIYFITLHSRRHVAQLDRICERVNS